MLQDIVAAAPLFLLVAIRALAMIETAPLLSSDSIPQVVKVALAGFTAFACYGASPAASWTVPGLSIDYVLLAVGEALIGVLLGLVLTAYYSAFSTAGQFFSLQMGFGASETYDPLSQVENPLMGQYLNLIGMLVFLTVGGFQRLFLQGFSASLGALSAVTLGAVRERWLSTLFVGLSRLFLDAMVLSMPILGTLFIVSLTMGLLSKAAPQMNLLAEGFPMTITAAFVLILATMPFLVEAFSRIVDESFGALGALFAAAGGGA